MRANEYSVKRVGNKSNNRTRKYFDFKRDSDILKLCYVN